MNWLTKFKISHDIALHLIWRQKIVRLYLFTCKPEISLAREWEAKLTRAHGTAMNLDTLSKLLKEYEELQSDLKSYPVFPVDTTETSTPLETAFEISLDILLP